MDQDGFEQLVAEALDTLPQEFLGKLDNVEVVTEDWPDRRTMQLAGASHPSQLLGFYHGIPQTRRTHNYKLVLPDKISIYRRPILRLYHTPAEIRAAVRRVVLHELAHHFGISDERLRELGAY